MKYTYESDVVYRRIPIDFNRSRALMARVMMGGDDADGALADLERGYSIEAEPSNGSYMSDDRQPIKTIDYNTLLNGLCDEDRSRMYLGKFFNADVSDGASAKKSATLFKWPKAFRDGGCEYHAIIRGLGDIGADGVYTIGAFNTLGSMSLSSMDGMKYVIDIDGDALDVTPENGDVLFDDHDEAVRHWEGMSKESE